MAPRVRGVSSGAGTGPEAISADSIRLKRAYEPVEQGDGVRVLVDRLWARGVSKEEAHLDAWMKELGPSKELREWFGHRPERWDGFQERYRVELATPLRQVLLTELQSVARSATLTLVYGARDTRENEAVVVRQYLLDSHLPAHKTPDDSSILLITAGAVAAGHVDEEIPAATLQLFAAPYLSGPTLDRLLQELLSADDLQRIAAGWQLTSRGHGRVRQLWSQEEQES